MLTLMFAGVSLLYATVGQAGGTAFLALMAFASFPSNEMRPTALLLNIIAATYSTWRFHRAGLVDWAKLRLLLIASLPTALVGGFIVLDERLYDVATGAVLLAAAAILAFRRPKAGEPDRLTPVWGAGAVGAGVGLVSGLTGVGGGVFLAPILVALQWASPKQTAALSAPFILANSAVGLIGAVYAGQMPTSGTWLYALAALAGAMIGTTIGLRWLSQTATRYVLAFILAAAAIQLLFFTGHKSFG
ncbi:MULTISPECIES: sulfite exporter TauE/SafE family protein [Bradyrhizobium]|uniref:sulfite exporter TauE/SafE family protein n=1 Tax=Bradyrhizobium elkanii TaxID=29448 RepID=UPI002714F7F0|nr:sulfite exporter TauE/SafE family protein [Bradyrhizobium elkanii]WLA47242.1 sulfite exporter TauE/SafE family protein [Bradyrhizobium elkanii]WLB82461.1 sulfite exporter TauE/SafE family protein [Bradyrhizobium elkanii]